MYSRGDALQWNVITYDSPKLEPEYHLMLSGAAGSRQRYRQSVSSSVVRIATFTIQEAITAPRWEVRMHTYTRRRILRGFRSNA